MTPRERITYALRMGLSHALYYGGLMHVLLQTRLRRKAVVLMYHRVLTRDQRARTASQQGLVVGVDTFARQVALIKRLFRVLTLEEFADHLAHRRPFDGPSCLITFDDGWIDNFENALPLLREHGLPAVMFLPVNFLGGRRLFTREALTHLLVKAVDVCRKDPSRRAALERHLRPLHLERVLAIADANPLPAVLDAIHVHRYASGPEFEAAAAALSRELGVAGDSLSPLDTFIDWTQVTTLGRHGFSFGGHGAEHRVLTQVTPDVARGEIESSKKVLDERLPKPAVAFAYPNGAWDANIAQCVQASGYRLAFTIQPGAVSCEDDPMSLRRVNIHEGMTASAPMFMARVTGVF